MNLIIENLNLFVGILTLVGFIIAPKKYKWLIFLIAVLLFGFALKSKVDTAPKVTSKPANKYQAIMKKINVYNDLEFIKQELGAPIKKHDQINGSWILEWEIEGLNIMLYHDQNENIDWIEFTPSEKSNLAFDIYSPKGFKHFDIGLGKIRYKDLINNDGSNVSDLVFEPRYGSFEASFIPIRYETYQGQLSETEYVNLFYFDETYCAEDFSIEKLMNNKVRSLRIELTSGYAMFDEEGAENGPLKYFITKDSLYNNELFVKCDY